jgi:hypothetical protein
MIMATGGETDVMIDYNHENARAGRSESDGSRFAHDFVEKSGDDVREKLIVEAGDFIL